MGLPLLGYLNHIYDPDEFKKDTDEKLNKIIIEEIEKYCEFTKTTMDLYPIMIYFCYHIYRTCDARIPMILRLCYYDHKNIPFYERNYALVMDAHM
jgi:hypothetical protein